MTTPRYLLARYIPDVWRMEPRNIGVIVWSPAGVAARFLGEKPEMPGEIDGRRIPSFVRTPSAYKQWIQQWQRAVTSGRVPWCLEPERADPENPEFLEELASSSRGNYFLQQGGILLDESGTDQVSDLVDYLFSTLVAQGTESIESHDPSLEQVCEDVITEMGLRRNPHFKSNYFVEYPLRGSMTAELEFSYAFVNGKVQTLYQRVPLPGQKVTMRRAVHDSAWMFEKVIESGIVDRGSGIALIRASNEQLNDPYARNLVAELETVANVVNVQDQNRLREEFSRFAHQIA